MIPLLVACGGGDPTTPPTDGTDRTATGETAAPAPTADTASTSPSRPPNLLLVVLDDVGIDKIAEYGVDANAPPTPTLSTLASEGVLFRYAYGDQVCGPARAMVLLGRYLRRYGFGDNPTDTSTYEIPDREVFLPRLLAHADPPYTSIATGKWGVRNFELDGDRMDDPRERGFLHHRGVVHNVPSYKLWIDVNDGEQAWRDGYLPTVTIDDTIAMMSELSEPWFVYVAPNSPHTPLHVVPDEFNTAGLTDTSPPIDLYGSMVTTMDHELGRLLDAIEPAERARTTIVVIGDNGTLDEVRSPDVVAVEGKNSMFEGGVRVPFLVSGPLVARPGSVSDRLVSAVDVAATLAELAGVDVDQVDLGDGLPLVLDGTSVVPQLRDPDAPGPAYAYSEFLGTFGPPPWPRQVTAVRNHRFKLITDLGVEALFEPPGGIDDGPDLLLAPPLSAEAEAALVELRAERDRIARIAYEGP